jgi:hypothetical protein
MYDNERRARQILEQVYDKVTQVAAAIETEGYHCIAEGRGGNAARPAHLCFVVAA